MALMVFEGTWEEVRRHEAELVGRRVRVTVQSDRPIRSRRLSPGKPSADVIQKRSEALNAWFTLARPAIARTVDDSRIGISGDEELRGW